MALFPALALILLAFGGSWGTVRATPASITDLLPDVAPQHSLAPTPLPAPQTPPLRNFSRSGGGDAGGGGADGWFGETHRGRRDTTDITATGSGRSSRIEPLFVDEPRYLLLERRETGLGVPANSLGMYTNDPFWVARGRRRDGASSSSFEEPFWAARGRRRLLPQLRGAFSEVSVEEPFWAARGRRGPGADDVLARTQRAVADSSGARWRRRQLESVEEPFWAARGRRMPRESLSVEEPFWAARGKKGVQAFQDLLSKVRARGASAEMDPFWAARGKRLATEDAEENLDDEHFWNALERRSVLAGR